MKISKKDALLWFSFFAQLDEEEELLPKQMELVYATFAQIEDAIDEKQMARIEAMILSMTPKERANPDILNPSRKRRIADGAGVDISEVNKLVKQFEQSRKMMKQYSGMLGSKAGKRGKFKLPF